MLSLKQRCVNKRIAFKKCQFSIKIFHIVLWEKEHVWILQAIFMYETKPNIHNQIKLIWSIYCVQGFAMHN